MILALSHQSSTVGKEPGIFIEGVLQVRIVDVSLSTVVEDNWNILIPEDKGSLVRFGY